MTIRTGSPSVRSRFAEGRHAALAPPASLNVPSSLQAQHTHPHKAIMGNANSQMLENLVQGIDRDEVDRLRKRFMKLDKDNSGTIERDEFLSLPQVSSNPLATRMIAIFDEDGGGDVDFQEFVSGLSAFSSKGNKEEKLRFAFKVYDIDRDGYISNGELFIVLKMMVGSNLKDQQLQQIVDKTIMEADLDRDGKISFDEFKKMVENTDVSNSMTLDAF
ncbi:calcineurin regulatory beta sub-unit [Aureobasidium pullulans]|uniref:Calcineurin subunit B n=1 Tax=Aureobasidium pullulans TaxID=5580 RepID=A0A4V4JY28_AURPU|nr:calcineurin regulatory beta sub-unit [Aureobasidium pullulans]